MPLQSLDLVESIAGKDEGRRGITPLAQPGSLAAASAALWPCGSVAILTGFSCFPPSDGHPLCETDGPPGALSIALTLRRLGRRVTLLTDEGTGEVLRQCVQALPEDVRDVAVVAFPPKSAWGEKEQAVLEQVLHDHEAFVSIERPGRAKDGNYYTMRAIDISVHTAPIDGLFLMELAMRETEEDGRSSKVLIGIGDGGNEVGMGRVTDLVERHVPRGDMIGCAVTCDHLLVCGVSNWGGYALSIALAASAASRGHPVAEAGAEAVMALVPTPASEDNVMRALQAAGVRDGISGAVDGSVDGLPYARHMEVLSSMREALAAAMGVNGGDCCAPEAQGQPPLAPLAPA